MFLLGYILIMSRLILLRFFLLSSLNSSQNKRLFAVLKMIKNGKTNKYQYCRFGVFYFGVEFKSAPLINWLCCFRWWSLRHYFCWKSQGFDAQRSIPKASFPTQALLSSWQMAWALGFSWLSQFNKWLLSNRLEPWHPRIRLKTCYGTRATPASFCLSAHWKCCLLISWPWWGSMTS